MKKILLFLGLMMVLCVGSVYAFNYAEKIEYKNNTYFIKDAYNKEIFNLRLVKNTKECLVNCEAEIKINSKDNYKTEQILKLLKINKDLKKFKKFNIEIKENAIKIKAKKKLKVIVLNTSKRGEQRIKILNNFDWKLSLLDKELHKWAWWNTSWSYRQLINISNTAGDLTNYQVRLDLDSSNVGSNFDWSNNGDDIRFANSTDDELYFWIEDWNSSSQKATIWVNVTSLPNNTNTTIYMYYGNPSASSASDVNSTFIREIDGLKGSWHFDEGSGTTAYDSSGNEHPATLYNGVSWETGKFGYALKFDGSDDYVDISSTLLSNSEKTISFWVKIDDVSQDDQFLISFYKDGNNRFHIQYDTSNSAVHFFIENANSVSSDYSSSQAYTTLQDGEWHQIVWVGTTTSNSVYIDNTEITDIAGDIGFPTIDSGDIFIGAYASADPPTKYFTDGIIDETKIFNKSLSTDEISDIYNYYGYTTENYPNKVLVKKYTDPEPTVSFGSEEAPINLQITSTEPEDKAILYEPNINFKVNVTWDNADQTNCSLYLNGVKNNTKTDCIKGINTIEPINYNYTIYNWFIKCKAVYNEFQQEKQSSTKIVAIAEAKGEGAKYYNPFNQTTKSRRLILYPIRSFIYS